MQKKDARGNGVWTKRLIDNSWSQADAVTLAHLNGDGRRELITGKRYYAHYRDPGANEPLGVYWYERRGRSAVEEACSGLLLGRPAEEYECA